VTASMVYRTAFERTARESNLISGSMAVTYEHPVVQINAVRVIDGTPEQASACFRRVRYAAVDFYGERPWPSGAPQLWCTDCYAELEDLGVVPSLG
jgi:hypothetical protein